MVDFVVYCKDFCSLCVGCFLVDCVVKGGVVYDLCLYFVVVEV